MEPIQQATGPTPGQAGTPVGSPAGGSAGKQPVNQTRKPAGRPAGKTATKPVRERLLDSADALLFVHGVISTPVDRILKDAQASPPSLYSHFGSKEGLIAAALRRRLHIWTGVWDAEIAAAETARGRALALWDALTTYQGEHMTERWCAFSGTASAIEHPGPQLQAVLDEETQLLRTRLLAAAREITGEDSRAEALASALMVAYTGTMSLMLREDYPTAIAEGRASAEALIDAYARA